MKKNRTIKKIFRGVETVDGAGVRLKRIFGYPEKEWMDPFLLLDHFGSDNPDDYIAGFPWHPHRGIETVTYMLSGLVEHGDSLGNKGVIGKGDIQWMTAGSGIIHQEMPKVDEKKLSGFQLWVNLPAKHKMMKPRYQDIPAAEIPVVEISEGINAKLIAGEINGIKGPVKDIVVNPLYADFSFEKNKTMIFPVKKGYTVFAYIYEGDGQFDEKHPEEVNAENLVLFDDGEELKIKSGTSGLKFILVSGKPIGETIAWRGPIVMNTDQELKIAFSEFENGTFIK